MDWKDKKVAILGWGVDTQDVEPWLRKQGAKITVLDEKPFGTAQGKPFGDLTKYDILVRSPGVYRYRPEFEGREVTSKTKIFFDVCPGKIIGVTGTKGKGTTATLIYEILYKAMMKKLHDSKEKPGKFKEIKFDSEIDKIIVIDQSPIGKTPRSNPATYTKVFDEIRRVFAFTKDAKELGFSEGRFSFNVQGGRCEHCEGNGQLAIEMHFLPTVYVPCDVCKGKRFNRETLEVKYRDKNIADVLAMTVEEASSFFHDIPPIYDKTRILAEVGLGYIQLGQSATTLSGGEAQRIKLGTELARRDTGKTFYLLDEPTTGLHFDDIRKLMDVLHRLVSRGNTVVIIEHNLDVIKNADWIIDLGPEGGDKGGRIVATGTPEQVAKHEKSFTGKYLKEVLKKRGSLK